MARRRAREDALDRFERARRIAGRVPGGTVGVDIAAPLWLGQGVRIRGDLASMRIAGHRIEAPRRFVRHAVLRPYEPLLTAWMDEHLRVGDVAVDVGAHVGLLTVPMAQRVGPRGRVIAVEPGPDNAGHLARNVAANGLTNVEIVRCALDATVGERLLHLGQASDSYGFCDHPNAPTVHHLPVPTTTLDALFTGPDAIADQVHLVKIDAEGAEPEILRGAEQLLAANPDLALAVEWNPKLAAARGQPLDLLPTMLRDLGRDVLVLDELRGRVTTVEAALDDVRSDPALFRRWYANLVDA